MPDTELSVNAPEQFEELYRRHGGRVMAYVLRRATSTVADDVVADVFLMAWRKLDDLPADPLPWLLGTARKMPANRRRGEETTGRSAGALKYPRRRVRVVRRTGRVAAHPFRQC